MQLQGITFLEIFPHTHQILFCVRIAISTWCCLSAPFGWTTRLRSTFLDGATCTQVPSPVAFFTSHSAVWGEKRNLLSYIVYWNSVAWVFAYACKQAMGDRGRDRDWALWLGDGKWLVCHFCSLSLWQWRNVSRTSIISSSNWSTLAHSLGRSRAAICISISIYTRDERERAARGQTSTSAQTSSSPH
jgi:hypothetical protein